jgi:hypothetical protein
MVPQAFPEKSRRRGAVAEPDHAVARRRRRPNCGNANGYGTHVDTLVKPPRPDLFARATAPDYALGPHTASLGLAYSDGSALRSRFGRGMFVGQHGS